MPRRLGPNDHGSAAWKELRLKILTRDRYRCYLCGDRATAVDHVTPRSHGGTSHPLNLRAICGPCNSDKSRSEKRGF